MCINNTARHFKSKHSLHSTSDFNLKDYVVGTPSLSNLNPDKKHCFICGKGITPTNKAKYMKNKHGA